MKRTYIYIDGFNLYYGAVKGTSYKWLNLRRMCELLLPKNDIVRVKYFTAKVSSRAGDLGQPARQQIYLRALQTLPNLEIIYGHFLTHSVWRRLANPAPGESPYVQVLKTEEKGSDVNLAAHLINDGYKGCYEVAAVISNDSDLLEPIKIVRRELGLDVVVINPRPGRTSKALAREASFVKSIRKWVLKDSQFAPTLRDAQGEIRKPPEW
jgi:uncharacterized LabA/DUF88 family protein